MYNRLILDIRPMGFNWPTRDPFLFCVHHLDHYPRGNGEMGPAASLEGRNLGQDFTTKDGWRMYHGEKIPGFPAHPHRGFETVTVVLDGFVDHSDSHGSSGRYGNGDVQWMTAGSGLQHAEMFPLVHTDRDNRLELFQIWLNLPAKDKFCKPYYTMLWAEDIPVITEKDENGRSIQTTIIAGTKDGIAPPPPAPDSWASDPANEVAVRIIRMDPETRMTLAAASPGLNRTLYFYRGEELKMAGLNIEPYNAVDLLSDEPVIVENGPAESFLLLLQGKPIAEPVAQHGPFVMNSVEEIRQAFTDYRTTQFGGWPWERHDNVHSVGSGRFARYADGRDEEKK